MSQRATLADADIDTLFSRRFSRARGRPFFAPGARPSQIISQWLNLIGDSAFG